MSIYGKWELRQDSYYYFSKDAWIYPSSNAVDQGKLTTEENVRNIYRDIISKNYKIKKQYFPLSININRNGVFVGPGEGVVQGYHFFARNTIEVLVPNVKALTAYTLGISLTYDAANHVTGDIVNRDLPIGESEILSGVYLKWFDECQLECWYDNILILGKAWVKDGKIVPDGFVTDDGEIIHEGLIDDPFNTYKFRADEIELEIYGHKTTIYDTLRDNITDIHNAIISYDSMHFPVEKNRQLRTKPPTFVSDVQDYATYLPDWYVSKYGDYMSGALRFNHLSLDAKREFLGLGIIKDDINNTYADGVLISPRTYGDLVRHNSDTVEDNPTNPTNRGFDYDVGGTILSIVPGSYPHTTDANNGYIGNHSALVSQKFGESGLRIHSEDGNNSKRHGTTRLVHYADNDDGQHYSKNNSNNNSINTSKFIIENIDRTGRLASTNIKNGEIFLDSFVSPSINLFTETIKGINDTIDYTGKYAGSGIQLYTSSPTTNTINNIDLRVDEYNITMAEHKYINHRTATRGNIHTGSINDTLHLDLGLGISYDLNTTYNTTLGLNTYNIGRVNNTDAYLELDNFRLRSNKITGSNVKQNTLEVLNIGEGSNNLPFIRIKPRVYTEQTVNEELIQLGTSKRDDYFGNNAQNNTLNRIVMKKVNHVNDNDVKTFTYFEQDYRVDDGVNAGLSKAFVKIRPPKKNTDITGSNIPSSKIDYSEIAGIYSNGNIGCSDMLLDRGKHGNTIDEENSLTRNNPYTPDKEWVRFTKFRYDNDKDQVNGGTFTGNHDNDQGRKWGESYNLEFNTNIANRRSNQIVWRYNGSMGKQNENTLANTPPVMLSYIHDTTESNQGTPTKYTNWAGDAQNPSPGYNGGKGTFETFIDHNGITHFNPTTKVRDFLLLENAGLSVSGDINNPSLAGDSLNANNRLGTVITQGRVYNSVYNDLSETFEKINDREIAEPGMLISLDEKTGKYKICNVEEDNLVVGVQSNTYGMLLGGNRIDRTQDIIELENTYFTVGISGKVWVNVVNSSNIKPGDLLTSSKVKGFAKKSEKRAQGTIIGKALTKPKYFDEYNYPKVLMLIMLG